MVLQDSVIGAKCLQPVCTYYRTPLDLLLFPQLLMLSQSHVEQTCSYMHVHLILQNVLSAGTASWILRRKSVSAGEELLLIAFI